MKTELNREQAVQMLSEAADKMIGQETWFCELDAGLGDGDHGVTVSRGFRAAKEVLDRPPASLEDLFLAVGERMGERMGGAVGPIYEMMFEGFAEALRGKEQIDGTAAAAMMQSAAEKISEGARVREGQKTMFDALSPAAAAMEQTAGQGEPLGTVLAVGAKAASEGAEKTREMMAAKGRARFLREKSVGPMDAGAASTAAFLRALSEYAAREQTEE